jgi:hypothetical protein
VTQSSLLLIATLLAVGMGSVLLRRAFSRTELLTEELALAGAWVFVVASLVWLKAFLSDETLLGFSAPWTWFTASHFAIAGFGALTVTALTCRVVSDTRALTVLRILVIAHPITYLVTAAGISGFPFCDELGAVTYQLLFVAQLGAVVLGKPNRMARNPRGLLIVALVTPVGTLVPALAWAWGHPIFDLSQMVRYHGLVNAVGHVGLGLLAFAWGRPAAHAPIRTVANPLA